MLDKIAAYLPSRSRPRAMVRGAMIYPGIIGTHGVGTTIFLLTFVLPRSWSSSRARKPPCRRRPSCCWPSPNFMTNYWYVLIFGLGAAIWGIV
jgi:type II secretory pathway component PulF